MKKEGQRKIPAPHADAAFTQCDISVKILKLV